MLDTKKLREDTQGVNDFIFFNNASASLRTKQVNQKMISYLEEEGKNGGYETAKKYSAELKLFYQEAAKLINALPEEIALVENASEAWNRAFFSIAFKKGDIILTSENEYASNFLNYLKIQNDSGIEIKVIPGSTTGEIDLNELTKLISSKVRLISITHIPTNSGLVNPIEKIGEIASKLGILYLLDTCQSIGQYPLDVKKIKCDFLTATGRKYLRGPRGTGFLFVKSSTLNKITPSSLDLHSAEWNEISTYTIAKDAKKFETWENNKASQIGLTEAIRYANNLGIENIWKRVNKLGEILREQLAKLDDIILCDRGNIKCGIVTFIVRGIDPKLLKEKLFEKKIKTNVSSAGSTLIDMKKRNLNAVNRASIHYYNTEQEIGVFIDRLSSIIKEQKGIKT